jgi:hypothetical protein
MTQSNTQIVNLFLTEDKVSGKIIDADKAARYPLIEDIDHDYLGRLDRSRVDLLQSDVVEILGKKSRTDEYNIDIIMPIYLNNCSDELISRHTARQFSDVVVLYNHDLINFFLSGEINEIVKKLFEYSENGNRKYMIFISLNNDNAIRFSLSSLMSNQRALLKNMLMVNNRRIEMGDYSKETHEGYQIQNIIEDRKHEYQTTQVGGIRIIAAPNFVLNYFSSMDLDGIRYHLRIDVVNNPSERNQVKIPIFLPISIVAVNRDDYAMLKKSGSFSFNALFVIDGANDDNERLKSNPNMIIGIISKDVSETVTIPITSCNDYIRMTIIMSYMNNYEEFVCEDHLVLGKMITAGKMINYTDKTIDIVKALLFNQEPLETMIKKTGDPDMMNALTFNSIHGDINKLERRFPMMTQLKLEDFRMYNMLDISSISEGKRGILQNGIYASETDNDKVLQCNGHIWIDRFWRIYNSVTNEMFNQLLNMFTKLSSEARRSAEDFYLYKNMYIPPIGMNKSVFNEIKCDAYAPSSREMNSKYVKFKIFHDFMSSMNIQGIHSNPGFEFSMFKMATELNDKISDEIMTMPVLQKIYNEELSKMNIRRIISIECENEASISRTMPRPFDMILTNFTVVIHFDRFFDFIDRSKIIPPKIKTYIQSAFSTIKLFKKGDVSMAELDVGEINAQGMPTFSSSSSVQAMSSRDAYQLFYEEGGVDLIAKKNKKLKIISLKNLAR